MAAHGEIQWPPVGRFNGRLWGELHGRRQGYGQFDFDLRDVDLSALRSFGLDHPGGEGCAVVVEGVLGFGGSLKLGASEEQGRVI